ncbi:MAG: TIGR01777 family oxidoreductase [Lentisphaerales bacterium]|nr:TIGR01777 family oxidoreductase [Lentisphaerales bacterium]
MIKKSLMPVSAEKLANWHNSPAAFGRIQPPWESAKILKKAKSIADNLEEHVQIKLGPLKKRWIARYHDVVPNEQFCDVQVEGPFDYWDHKHVFKSIDRDTSELVDDVTYKEPLGLVGRFLGGRVIQNKLNRMFKYRHEVTKADLERHFNRDIKSMRILIIGGTGLIGSSLEPFLTMLGHEVEIMTRNPTKPNHIGWNPDTGEVDLEKLEGFDAFIHLSGKKIIGLWTEQFKHEAYTSRIDTSRLLVESIQELENPPKIVLAASASAYYPNKAEAFDETSPKGEGFLQDLVADWDAQFEPLKDLGIRTVNLRIGAVLTPAGGALQQMLPVFNCGLGGRVGSGEQMMSWIAMDDLLDIVESALEDERYFGPVNVVSPNAVTNLEFTKTLARVLKRPAILPVPEFVLKKLPGNIADEMFLANNWLKPAKLDIFDYEYRYPDLAGALRHVLGL